MIVTTAEARERWCPHVVASHTDPRIGFSSDARGNPHTCIGPDCMAWRWIEALRNGRTPEERRGFCGLSGPCNVSGVEI